MQEVRFRKGETIFSQGESSTHCYKILSGKVEITLNLPGILMRGRKETVGTCEPGEIIGAMSAIEKGSRSASAVAVEPTVCISYTSDEIVTLLENDPAEALAYIRTLIRNQRSSNQTIAWSINRRRIA